MKATDIKRHEIVATPIPSLNQILGGGFPSKIIIEVAGPPASGKSTLALQFIAQAQRLGRPCYYADAERAINFVEFATNIGVDCAALEYDKQPFAEALLQNLINWATEKKNGVLVVDAVGSLLGREEAEKEMEGRSIGIQSKMIATFCRHHPDDPSHGQHCYNHPILEEIKSFIQSTLDKRDAEIKGKIGFLRQWLNEKPADRLVTNEEIEFWLFGTPLINKQ